MRKIQFYASQVISIDESVLTVRFIDYGNTEQKTLKEIFRWKHFDSVYSDLITLVL